LSQSGAAALLLTILAGALLLYFAGVPNGTDIAIILVWFFLSLGAAGVIMLLRAPIQWWRKGTMIASPPRMLPEMRLVHYLPPTRHRRVPLMTDLPNFGMYVAWFLNIQMFVLMLFTAPRPARGLWIQLPGPYFAERPGLPQSETLGVFLDKRGVFYVNGQAVPREQLRAKLQEELSHRVSWTVYVEADDDVAYGGAVFAMDTIRGLGAQVVLMTPRAREELKTSRND
jgi:biopolymer transport protein ExbD